MTARHSPSQHPVCRSISPHWLQHQPRKPMLTQQLTAGVGWTSTNSMHKPARPRSIRSATTARWSRLNSPSRPGLPPKPARYTPGFIVNHVCPAASVGCEPFGAVGQRGPQGRFQPQAIPVLCTNIGLTGTPTVPPLVSASTSPPIFSLPVQSLIASTALLTRRGTTIAVSLREHFPT